MNLNLAWPETRESGPRPEVAQPGLLATLYPATSVVCEQAFSTVQNLITDNRKHLGEDSIKASMLLCSW